MTRTNTTFDLLGRIYMQLQRSQLAYRNYHEDGRKFLHAKILRNCNESLRNEILTQGYLLQNDLRRHALELVKHLDVWMEKWQAHELLSEPSLDTEFIFENRFTFPRQAAESLENAFLAEVNSDRVQGHK